MILDARLLLTYFDRSDPGRWAAAGRIEFTGSFEQLVVSPFVIAELEGMVLEQFGVEGWLAVLDELAGGAWTIAAADLAGMRSRIAAGETLAAASVAVLAEGEAS